MLSVIVLLNDLPIAVRAVRNIGTHTDENGDEIGEYEVLNNGTKMTHKIKDEGIVLAIKLLEQISSCSKEELFKLLHGTIEQNLLNTIIYNKAKKLAKEMETKDEKSWKAW